MGQESSSTRSTIELTKRRERAERILDAASELLLRYGYNRITIDDIARKAKVGKGTVYLHWRTRESLFGTLMLREVLAFWREILTRLHADPTEVLLHRAMRSMIFVGMERPLGRALFTGNRELLGKLAESGFGGLPQSQQIVLKEGYLALLRSHGLLRSDTDRAAQEYALRATVNGFLHLDSFLTGEEQLPIEVKADALAQTIRRAFEPDELPSGTALQDAASNVIEWLEQLCAITEQRLNEQMT
ncbi:MAG: TetR/AcrR family transcriptional regulator [Chloroflexota bacterium]|jgi:AcrR family transcriptional regulator